MKRLDYSRLSTEKANPRSQKLDRLSPRQIVALMNREDAAVLSAIRRASPAIARAIRLLADAFNTGHRFLFVGAGTSGRLGVIEAAECPPTFNTRPDQIQAVMAGGRSSVFRSKEGAEDRASEGARAVRSRVRRADVVIGIAASGVTPFVRAALVEARKRNAKTILITCNPDVQGFASLDVCIKLSVGPEVLTGSTRLKSGTACKMVLNMLTVGSMAQSGKMYGHWMVDLQPRSQKLVARGLRLIQTIGHVSPGEAERIFLQARRRVKPAILMARKKVSYAHALSQLKNVDGFLGRALDEN